jgi:hypothetical protein
LLCFAHALLGPADPFPLSEYSKGDAFAVGECRVEPARPEEQPDQSRVGFRSGKRIGAVAWFSQLARQTVYKFFSTAITYPLLTNTTPDDVFVTDLRSDDFNPTAFPVMAAGRQLAIVPKTFSNPYVDWNKKNDLRLSYLDAVSDPGRPGAALCGLGHGHGWLLLPNDFKVIQVRAEPVFRTPYNTGYRITGSGCP